MRQRQVYIDFGAGFVNVSHLVKYDTLTITHRAFNDSYRYVQNECSFDIIYDPTIFPLLRYATNDFAVRIVELLSDVCITTENDWFLTTEDSFAICAETDIALPVFYGHIPPTTTRNYNGILENTILRMEAIDDLDKLAVPVGDIVYANHAVLDPTNPSASIVHKLCAIAGFTGISSTVAISTVVARFAPDDIETTVLDVLNDLLYEYGYTLNLDESGTLTPILWNIPEDTISTFTFDESNIVMSVNSSRDRKVYDSVKCIYYDLNSASKIRLFTDGNCGFNADGTFAGYVVLNNTYYPPEANVIDDTTGTYQIVEQEYTDDAIKYFTNKAIKENLDYSYKNFSSDFSAIVATENQFVDRRIDSGLTVVTETFGNKKCRVLYQNTSGTNKNIWYNNIYGDVWYKSAERSVTREIVSSPKKEYSYTSKYIFSQAVADAFVQGLSAQFALGKVTFKFSSERDYREGTAVTVLTNDGTNQLCLIRERVWDEYKEMWDYTLVACSEDKGELTSRTSTVNVTVTPASPFSIRLSTGVINVPYNGTTPDFTNCFVTVNIYRDGLDVTNDWTISAVPTNVTGTFSPANKYTLNAISATNGSVQINATRAGWGTLTTLCNVVKALGQQGATGATGPKGPGLVYRGVGIPNSYTSSTFVNTPIQYVRGVWGFASASGSNTADVGDLLFVRHFAGEGTDGARKVYQWTGSQWSSNLVTRDMLVSAASDLMDVCRIYGTPTNTADSAYVWYDTLVANQSFIDFLMVSQLKVLTGGSIRGGDRFNADGTDSNPSADGFWLGANGTFKCENGYFSGVLGQEGKISIQDYFQTFQSASTPSSTTRKIQIWGQGIYFSIYNTTSQTWEEIGYIAHPVLSTDKTLYLAGKYSFSDPVAAHLTTAEYVSHFHGTYQQKDIYDWMILAFTGPYHNTSRIKVSGSCNGIVLSHAYTINSTTIRLNGATSTGTLSYVNIVSGNTSSVVASFSY